jgi:predicted PurR-regulated permease PerM
MALSIAYFQYKGEMKKPLEMLKLQGKLEELKDAIEKTKSIESRFTKILNQLGIYIYSVLDIPAYTFLLPVIPFIISFISNPSMSGDNLEMALNGLLNSSLITLSGATLKKVLEKLSSYVKTKN